MVTIGRRSRARWIAVLVLGLAAVPLACGGDDPRSPVAAAHLDVVTSFYPLQYVVERVGAGRVSVSNLTPPGVEPHDLELTAHDTVRLRKADIVVYLAGFSPAVDEAVGVAAQDHALDVASSADLSLRYTPIEEGAQHAADRGTDPHFWLDPTRLGAVARAVAERFGRLDPGGAAVFERNAAALDANLAALDAEYAAGLMGCARRAIVTSHNAFGYLAERYSMTQVGITGLTPDEEPSPAQLAEVSAYVEEHDVETIYYETLVSPDIAQTVAAETGAATAVLDPIEGVSETSQGTDYIAIMRVNLANLIAGQGCG